MNRTLKFMLNTLIRWALSDRPDTYYLHIQFTDTLISKYFYEDNYASNL